jgi:plastocyanin
MSGHQLSRRQFIRRTGGLAVALGFVPLIQACGSSANSQSDKPEIEMNDEFGFEPKELTIEVGQTVTWKNVGTMVHTSTNDPSKAQKPEHSQLPQGAAAWDSGLLHAGQTWTYTFDVAGNYTYFCIPHESMSMIGKITVKP